MEHLCKGARDREQLRSLEELPLKAQRNFELTSLWLGACKEAPIGDPLAYLGFDHGRVFLDGRLGKDARPTRVSPAGARSPTLSAAFG